MRRAFTILAIAGALVGATVHGCFDGGANPNQQAPGNNDQGGVDLGGHGDSGSGDKEVPFGELAIDPTGSYFLSRSGSLLLYGDLATGEVKVVGLVFDPDRVAFASGIPRFYVTAAAAGHLYAVDAASQTLLWGVSTAQLGDGPRLYASRDDAYLVVRGDTQLEVRVAATGKLVASLAPGGTIRDVDLTPDSATAVITLDHTWNEQIPETRILQLDLATGHFSSFTVPNCASPLVLTPDGKRAFLAPTDCVPPPDPVQPEPPESFDPVSVLDLQQGAWVRNLPGFGPVAMAPDGITAVAFMDAENLDLSLFDDLSQVPDKEQGRYHLMLLDTKDLTFSSVPLGDKLPRYALTPDGKVVLIDNDSWWNSGTSTQGIRVLDVTTKSLEPVSGPAVELDHFAVSPNSADVFLLYSQELYWLSIPERKVELLPLPFSSAALNILPGGDRLLLLDTAGTLHLYAPASRTVVHSMLPPAG